MKTKSNHNLLHRIPGIAVVGLLAAACQTIHFAPERKAPDATLLIIPLKFQSDSGETPFVLSLSIDGTQDSKTGDLVDFTQSYAFIRDIMPGKHRITGVLVRWKPTGQIVQQKELNIPFELTAGQAILLPVRFSINVKSNRSYFTTYSMPDKDIETTWAELSTYQNLDTWVTETGGEARPAVSATEPRGEEQAAGAASDAASQPEPAPPEAEAAPAVAQPNSTVPAAKATSPVSSVPAIAAMQEKRYEEEFYRKTEAIDRELYQRWLRENDLVDSEASSSYSARLEILDEFLTQSRTRGNAVEAMVAAAFPFVLRQDRLDIAPGYISTEQGWGVGGTIAWSYQVDSRYSLGVNLSVIPVFLERKEYDDLGAVYQESGFWSVIAWLGPFIIYGDKATSFAGQFSTGLGASSGLLLPIRLGMYYRNFYVGYLGLIPITDNDYGDMISGIEAGYSIFFGTKRTWPE